MNPAVLTPQSIVQAIPTVTLQPLPVYECDWWSELNANIEQNPLIAVSVLVLAGLAAVSHRKGRK